MNNGFWGFQQSNYGTSVIEVKEFDSSGTYQIPNGTKRLWIMLIGGGGGGGAGDRQASNSIGGNGGSGGGINTGYYFISSIGGSSESTPSISGSSPGSVPSAWGKLLTITIGAGGAGGAGSTLDNSGRALGTPGGDSLVTLVGYPGYLMTAYGGKDVETSQICFPVINGFCLNGAYVRNGIQTINLSALDLQGVRFSYSSGLNGENINPCTIFDTFGCPGGAVSAGTPYEGGGFESPLTSNFFISAISNPFFTGKVGGAANTATSQISENLTLYGPYSPGLGGFGGGASSTTAANNGTNGYRGGGGGGGGGSLNGFTSGSGGNGGNGYCVIVALGM